MIENVYESLITQLRNSPDEMEVALLPLGYSRFSFGDAFPFQVPVAMPSTERDVVWTVNFSKENSIDLYISGAGHSWRSINRHPSLILQTSKLTGFGDVSVKDVWVGAGERWSSIENKLNAIGRSFPVLTSHTAVTVGGTLSSGGYGESTIAYGPQAANVNALKIVTPDGEIITASNDENSDEFRLALFGQGQVGVITAAQLRTIPLKELQEIATFEFRSFMDLISGIKTLEESGCLDVIRYFKGQFWRGLYLLNIGVDYTNGNFRTELARILDSRADSEVRYDVRLEKQWHQRGINTKRIFGRNAYIWRDYIVGANRFIEFSEYVSERIINSQEFNSANGRVLLLADRSRAKCGVFQPNARISEDVYGIGIYFEIDKDDINLHTCCMEFHRIAGEKCVELGGRLHLNGYQTIGDILSGETYREETDMVRSYIDKKNSSYFNPLFPEKIKRTASK